MIITQAESQSSPEFNPVASVQPCDHCGWTAVTQKAQFWRLDNDTVCMLCRYDIDPEPHDDELLLLLLPELDQRTLNAMIYQLVLPLIAKMEQSTDTQPANEGALAVQQQLLDALGQRQQDSVQQLPVLSRFSSLTATVNASPDQAELREAFKHLRYLPNLNNAHVLKGLQAMIA